ncbi:MAG: serine/threonine protein kinase [Deltaproteobacteria bacterium]|nr:serine/threonine protein kinase [Deltaproteobacteria bacterium]
MSDAGATPAAANAMPGFSPEAYGKYYLIDKIAVGGMAEIFKAKTFGHGGFENTFVVKRILQHMSDNEQFVQMFLDEAKVTAQLQHANVVRVWEYGKIGTNYFLSMDFVDGKDSKMILRKLFERRKMIPREFAVYIAMETAKGLDYAHKRTTNAGAPLDIVHRDVSPSNILVSYTGEVKVADFGIVQASGVLETTTKGTLKGKIEYMSPEQALGEVLDRRSDVFALGIVMWEMLTGRRAFKTDNEIKTLERVRNVEIEPACLVNNQVPTRLSEIVMRCLEKDPADRYQDARELHADLLNFLYPATPDVVQQSLHHFMSELFADDIATERGRVEESTRLARAMHEAEPSVELQEDWEEGQRGGSEPTVAPVKTTPAPSRLPILLGAAALAVALGVVGLGGLWMVNQSAPAPEVKTEIVQASPSIVLRVAPVEGVVKLDGKDAGKGTSLTLRDVPLGKHTVEVTAEGYEPYSKEIEVGEGEKLLLDVKLAAVRKPPEMRLESPPKVAPAEARIEPSATPQPAAKVDPPPPPPAEKAKGKVNINVSGGWADIYVDGKKIGTTPIFGLQLPVGTYAVRAKNEQTGLDATKQVTVKEGEAASVAFSAQ